jgi:hypothetical protein
MSQEQQILTFLRRDQPQKAEALVVEHENPELSLSKAVYSRLLLGLGRFREARSILRGEETNAIDPPLRGLYFILSSLCTEEASDIEKDLNSYIVSDASLNVDTKRKVDFLATLAAHLWKGSTIRLIQDSKVLYSCLPQLSSAHLKARLTREDSHCYVLETISAIARDGGVYALNPNREGSGKCEFTSHTIAPNLFWFGESDNPFGLFLEFSRHPPYLALPLLVDPVRATVCMTCTGSRGYVGRYFLSSIIEAAIEGILSQGEAKEAYEPVMRLHFNNKHIWHSLGNVLSLVFDVSRRSAHKGRFEDLNYRIEIDSKRMLPCLWPVGAAANESFSPTSTTPAILLEPHGCFVSRDMATWLVAEAFRSFEELVPLERRCSVRLLEPRFPVVLISLRPESIVPGVVQQNRRQALNQADVYTRLIRRIVKNFPTAAFVLDGALTVWNEAEYERSTNLIESFSALADSLEETCRSVGVPCLSLIGTPTYEAIVVDQAIDCFVSPIGSGLTRYVLVSELSGVVHTTYEYFSRVEQRIWNSSAYSDSASEIEWLFCDSQEYIIDVETLYTLCQRAFTKKGRKSTWDMLPRA